MKKALPIILLIFLLQGCIDKYGKYELETETEIIVPFAFGSYLLGDLFYDFDDTVKVSTGQFFQLSDTISLNDISILERLSEVEILFQSINVMPFKVDLELTPFDTIESVLIGDPIRLTIVEAASSNNDLSIFMPTYWENSIDVNPDLLNSIQKANSMLIEMKFIWPFERISVSVNEELKAFDLTIILKIKL